MRAYFEGQPDTYVFKNIRTMFGEKRTNVRRPLTFKERVSLHDKYRKWAKKNRRGDTSFLVLNFLADMDMIDTQKVRETFGEK